MNALITGGSKGLGRALTEALLDRNWTVVTDARSEIDLAVLRDEHPDVGDRLVTIAGDIADADHRRTLRDEVNRLGRLDLLVNNASTLGATPLPRLGGQPAENLADVYGVNVLAPHALTTLVLPVLRANRGVVINVTSDAAVEGYPGWGAYGASKAALEQWSNILAAEEPDLAVYWVDPGDLHTELHQQAFPGEDISDRPPPSVAVPGFMHLVDHRPPSGRFRAQQVVAA
ncbi:MAG: SDR family NAD(P)-dependent oxidoreductase [Ilumatobacteraceae bacterium]